MHPRVDDAKEQPSEGDEEDVPKLLRKIGTHISLRVKTQDTDPAPVSRINAEASVGVESHHFDDGIQIVSPISQSPLGSPVRFGRRAFKRVSIRNPVDDISEAPEGQQSVQEAACAASAAAAASAYLLKPFWSNITGSLINWQTDADVGLVLERRTITTAVGRGRKEVVSIRKIWPWSPAFASGAIVMHDILVSIDGSTVDEMELADVRALLKGEEGSTVILETLHVVKGKDLEPDQVLQQYVELARSVDYLRREPVIISHRDRWPNPNVYQDRALFCLQRDSSLRKAAIYLIESRVFKVVSFFLIVASSVLIGLDDPLEATAAAQRQHVIERPCTTTQGDKCHFPFEYRGVTYSECTRTFYGLPWCATSDNYELDKEWGYCDAVLCDKLGPGYWRHTLGDINVAVASLLIAETVPAIVAQGLLFGHNAFLRSTSNQVDFVVLICNILDLTATLVLPQYLQSPDAIPALDRNLLRSARALRALRLLRLANQFSVMRNTMFLLGSVSGALLVSVAVNAGLLIAAALTAQELWSASLHFGCHSISTGVKEWPPRKCDPTGPAGGGGGGGGFSGGWRGLQGRACPSGFSCIGGREQDMEEASVWVSVEDGATTPQGLAVSFSNGRAACSTVLTALMLDTWMTLLAQLVEAVGPLSIAYAVMLLVAGPFFAQQLFIATMSLQLEKIQDRSSMDVARKVVTQWLFVFQHQAFKKWQAHWYERGMVASKAIRERMYLHRHEMERTVLRWKNLEMLEAWNGWVAHVEAQRDAARLRELIGGGEEASGNADAVRLEDNADAKRDRGKKRRGRRRFGSDRPGMQVVRRAMVALATSAGLEKFIASLVLVSVVLMGLQGSCDSKLGRVLGCSSDDRTSFMTFMTTVETLMLTATSLFALEALLKLLALGPKRYLSSFGNIFDFVITVVALSEVVVVGEQISCQIQAIQDGKTATADVCYARASSAQALRALRLVRLARLLRRYPAMRRVALSIHYVLGRSWGALALYVLCTGMGAVMGFILLGGKIYDVRGMPSGAQVAAPQADLHALVPQTGSSAALSDILRHAREQRFVIPHSRVLLYTPGREPEDDLLGWPARLDVALSSPTTRIRGSVSGSEDGAGSGSMVDSVAKWVGLGDEDEDAFLFARRKGLVNVSTLESFVRGNVIDQALVELEDYGIPQSTVFIAATVPERINFETMTEALISASQIAVGTGFAPIFARARLALPGTFVGELYVLAFLFLSRAVLGSLFTALFYVHLCQLSVRLREADKLRQEEAKLRVQFLNIQEC